MLQLRHIWPGFDFVHVKMHETEADGRHILRTLGRFLEGSRKWSCAGADSRFLTIGLSGSNEAIAAAARRHLIDLQGQHYQCTHLS